MAKPEILKVEPRDGITLTNEEEACKVSRREEDKAIRKDQGRRHLYF